MNKLLSILTLLGLMLAPVSVLAQSYDGTTIDSESDGKTYTVTASSGDTVTLNNVGDDTDDISITFSNSVDGSIVVEQLDTRPTEATSSPDGTVDVYFDVTLNSITNDDISSATWTFTVSQTWLQNNDASSENVFLQHWSGSSWERLSTTIVSTSDDTVTLSADVNSFSPFATTAVDGLSNTGSPYLTGAILAVGILIATAATFKLSRSEA